jgi:dihydrofolate reductase
MHALSKMEENREYSMFHPYALPSLSPRTHPTDGLMFALPVEHHDAKTRDPATLVVPPVKYSGILVSAIDLRSLGTFFRIARWPLDNRPMTIYAVVACDRHSLIGQNNHLPWNCPEDLQHFKQLTLGQKVLLGRSTFESILDCLGSPLPERKHVVLTHRPGKSFANVVYESVLDMPRFSGNGDLYVIGGASVYAQCAEFLDVIFLSLIKGNYHGNLYLPNLGSDWFLEKSEDRGSFFLLKLRRKPKNLCPCLFRWEELETFQT